MLNRVGAALAKFVQPVASSQLSGASALKTEARPEKGLVRQPLPKKKDSKKEESPPQNQRPSLALVRGGKASSEERQEENPQNSFSPIQAEGVQPVTSQRDTLEESQSVSHAFLQLLSKLNDQKRAFLKWMGLQAYEAAIKRKKKTKSTRGAIVNRIQE